MVTIICKRKQQSEDIFLLKSLGKSETMNKMTYSLRSCHSSPSCIYFSISFNLFIFLSFYFLVSDFVYVSMGSSVRASGMPDALREMFVAAFSTLPYNVVWKWEGGKIEGLPGNVRIAAWWPQQELLGHPKIRAFVSHGGLLSLHEAAYHGTPTLVLPVFCDHDGNAAQAGTQKIFKFTQNTVKIFQHFANQWFNNVAVQFFVLFIFYYELFLQRSSAMPS